MKGVNMFNAAIYKQRRSELKKQLGSGFVIFLGNDDSPMNYPANPYHFRQDSNFLYFWGLDTAGINAAIDVDADKDYIFGDELTMDDIIWMGFLPSLKDRALEAGVTEVKPGNDLKPMIENAIQNRQKVHFLPQYRTTNMLKIEELLGIHQKSVNLHASQDLISAIIQQRSVKSPEEVEQIEQALDISYKMHTYAMQHTRPGMLDKEMCGMVQGIAASAGGGITSFPVIFSVHGETLHNHYHGNEMKDGRLVVHDSGAESVLHYASDITRTYPVNGKFSSKQKDIYEIVLKSQIEAINLMKPGIKNKDIHLHAAKVIAEGLKGVGLMKGDIDQAVELGAHALFFPHGLGHMMGLDVHDMEDLGENFVGYDQQTKRSDQFGLAFLRFGKELKKGYVMTVEPGCYFIPALIDQWKSEYRFTDYIDYEKVEEYKDFGGIRIEEDVLITDNGHKILGKPIPKSVEEVEEWCSKQE